MAARAEIDDAGGEEGGRALQDRRQGGILGKGSLGRWGGGGGVREKEEAAAEGSGRDRRRRWRGQ